MSRRGERIATRMADKILRESGRVSKSYGGRQQVIELVSPVAEAIVMLDKAVKRYDRSFSRLTEANSRRLDELEMFTMNGNDPFADSGGVPAWHPERN
jgi:hypothetical protein